MKASITRLDAFINGHVFDFLSSTPKALGAMPAEKNLHEHPFLLASSLS